MFEIVPLSARLGCGVIGITSDFSPAADYRESSAGQKSPGLLTVIVMAVTRFWQQGGN